MIEIPDVYKRAWQAAQIQNDEGVLGTIEGPIADALIFALTGWNRERFEREHPVGRYQSSENYLEDTCLYCPECGTKKESWDERHTWTDEQWQQAVREELEGR